KDIISAAKKSSNVITESYVINERFNVKKLIGGLGLAASTVGWIGSFVNFESLQFIKDYLATSPEVVDVSGKAWLATVVFYMVLMGISGLFWYAGKHQEGREKEEERLKRKLGLGEQTELQWMKDVEPSIRDIIDSHVDDNKKLSLLDGKKFVVHNENVIYTIHKSNSSPTGVSIVWYDGDKKKDSTSYTIDSIEHYISNG
ncbi:MAG: hypothetical protein GTO02_21810, partial [Candidatus Dadabacteria bacterium]|nr:hypothetical protein [Candidatus Dadabacteria bacterium]